MASIVTRDGGSRHHWHSEPSARLPGIYRQYCRLRETRTGSVITKADIFIMIAVIISFALGVYLFFSGYREQGLFAATWVPAILAFGIYFKLMTKKP